MRTASTFSVLFLLLNFSFPSFAWVPSTATTLSSVDMASTSGSRRGFLHTLVSAGSLVAVTTTASPPARAANTQEDRTFSLSDEQLKEIVKQDVVQRQFLVTGNLTPDIYKSTATFTDEIDTYKMDQWIKGTQKLFVGDKSDVRLVGDVEVTADKVEFRFDEDLMFNLKIAFPTVSLSGKVVLTRDESGFITSYREFWDQDVATVLKTAKF